MRSNFCFCLVWIFKYCTVRHKQVKIIVGAVLFTCHIVVVSLYMWQCVTDCQESAIHSWVPPAVNMALSTWRTPLTFLSRYVDEILHVLDPFIANRSVSSLPRY